jgi:hypothetical protein
MLRGAGDHLRLLKVYRAYKQSWESADWCNDNFLSHRSLKAADRMRSALVWFTVILVKYCHEKKNRCLL